MFHMEKCSRNTLIIIIIIIIIILHRGNTQWYFKARHLSNSVTAQFTCKQPFRFVNNDP